MIENFFSTLNSNNCLVNLSNSIANSFGLPVFHSTLSSIDAVLQKKKRNVVLFLLDGLGRNILERHLKKDSFLRSHLVDYFSSVFPPTTVAATTSILSGKFPIEHGRLGWDMYFPEEDQNISLFPNTVSGTDKVAVPYNAAWRHYPYNSLIERIQEAGFHAYFSAGHEVPHPKNFCEILARVHHLCELSHRKFIYAYYEQPDSLEHLKGTDSPELITELQNIDERLSELTTNLEDTTFIITADHGHVDIKSENLSDHPELTKCFSRTPSLEARAINFFILKDKCDEFVKKFNEVYGNKDFLLVNMEEVLTKKFFGEGIPHPAVHSALGDYLAISVGDKALFINGTTFKGHHSGATREEFEIPLIVSESKK